MSLEGIQKKIRAAGEKERAEVLKQFTQEKIKIERMAIQDIQSMRGALEKEILRRKAEILERARIEANLVARNQFLQKKQDLVDQVFVAVRQYLGSLEGSAREKLLASWLSTAVAELGQKDARVVAAKPDQAALRRLVKKYRGLKLQEGTLKSDGGFKIANAMLEQNYTIQSFVEEQKEQWEYAVAQILFV